MPTSTQTQTGRLPAYLRPYYKDLLKQSQGIAGQGYTPYGDPRLAEFGADTEAGFGAIRDIAGSGPIGAYTQAQETLGGIAGNEGLGSFTDPGVAGQYMNPYIGNVLDAGQARLNQNFAEQQVGREGSAAQAGAFGGSRSAVENAIANRELNMQSNEMAQQGLAAAYQSGADIYGAEQGRELDMFGLQTGAAMGLADVGGREEAANINRAGLLTGIGGTIEDKEQAGLDVGYADFLGQRDWGKDQMNFYSGILGGTPYTPTQTSSTYTPPPSTTSQLLGLGIGGLSLYNALG